VPAPVPTASGLLFKNIRGHYYWIYKYIDGEVIENLNRSHLVKLARMMAEYHLVIEKAGLENRIGPSDVFSRGYVLKEMGGFRREILRETKRNVRDATFFEESTELITLLKRLDDAPYRRLKRYHIHRDIIPENLIWKRGELVGLIDFENVSRTREPLVKDVAVTLQFTCRDKKSRHGLDAELARVFLRAYMKRHPLSRKEIRLIPELLVSGLIEDFEYAYWMLRNDPERARLERLTLYSAAAQWAFENREQLARELFS
jgi:Ser/Thr protein kinase RdoA (MazF antagonist)